MRKRTIIYSRQSLGRNDTQSRLLQAAVEGRGDAVTATFADDSTNVGKGRYRGWRAIVSRLPAIDQIVVGSAVDLPGRTMTDLVKLLALLNEHQVSLVAHREMIDTNNGAAAILHLIATYRAAKVSEAIRDGQRKARTMGKRIGRPQVPDHVRGQIVDALTRNHGVRPTARRFGVSPATVINIRASMGVGPRQITG